MAAPSDLTMDNLTGVWEMDKGLSDDMGPILELQGLSWFLRTAIAFATATMKISEYTDVDPTTSKSVVRIDITQTLTGGLAGTTEKRILSWTDREHKDYIFGHVVGRGRLFRGSKDEDGRVRPAVDMQTKHDDPKIKKFLRGEIHSDGSPAEGFLVEEPKSDMFGEGEGLWLQSFARNVDSGWTAEQIWGFEMVNGKRFYTRRIAVTSANGKYVLARMVVSFLRHKEE
ncbi:hypothetical protein V8E54_013005 [Elaphomyces granulatus]